MSSSGWEWCHPVYYHQEPLKSYLKSMVFPLYRPVRLESIALAYAGWMGGKSLSSEIFDQKVSAKVMILGISWSPAVNLMPGWHRIKVPLSRKSWYGGCSALEITYRGYEEWLFLGLCGPSSLNLSRTGGSPGPSSTDSSGDRWLLLISSGYCFRDSWILFKGGKSNDRWLPL